MPILANFSSIGVAEKRQGSSTWRTIVLDDYGPGHLLHPGRGLGLVENAKAFPGDIRIIALLRGNGNEAASSRTELALCTSAPRACREVSVGKE